MPVYSLEPDYRYVYMENQPRGPRGEEGFLLDCCITTCVFSKLPIHILINPQFIEIYAALAGCVLNGFLVGGFKHFLCSIVYGIILPID